ncbi:hypothetical protein FGIG_05266 [Fasciola gigantica]|uniref:Ig-like domain-containing protein n=1 Tax=Fasciola gigantica TaxID=46835 RepID=A0A504Y8F6_FASGI|nr:hypothetical protein FGIG_05266 [Fasciola gigantica]
MISLNSCWIIQLFLLFHPWAAIATTPTLDTQEQIVHLQPSITLYNNTVESLQTIRVICPTGTQWTVPDTIESSAQILLEYHASKGSLLTIHLPVNKTASRTAFRGLYECCPMQLEVPRSLSWMKRPSQPICCPCCPWYEQHLCLTRELTSTPFERQSKSSCSGLFLFTGTVNTEPVRLYIVPDEPMLLPCPAPFHWVNSGNKTKFPLTVRHQFFLHTTLGTPWFPFAGNDLGINHTYDPRYGLCLHRAQFPRTTLQLACHYESASQVRLVQTFWPPSSPTIPPVVQLRFASSWRPRTIEPNWNEYQHVNEGVQTEAIYRARVGDSLRLQCIGIYTQSRIVKQPPPKLCFLWSWFKANETESIKPYNVTSNATHDWHLSACPDIQSTSKPRSAVYATNDMELPPINRPITVACQVRTPTRVAPAVSRQVRVVPVLTNSNRISWMIGFHNQQSVMLIPLNRTLEQTRSNHTALLMISAQDDNKTEFKVFVRLYFWAEHETSDWPACVFDNQTIPTGSIRSVRRVRDMWQCDITWYQTTQATNVPIILRYANLTQSIVIFTTTTLNGTTPQLTGLHGNVRKTMQLTCLRTKQEQALSRLFDSHFVKKSYSTRFIWNIELQDGPQGLTHAFNLSQNQPTLVLQPLHEENSTLVWSYSIASNQTISDFPDTGLPVPVRGPRFICAQCCSVYMEQVMWAGPPKCQKLTEWPLDSWPQYNTSSPQAKLALFLRQKEMPTQSWYNATQNPIVFYVLENVPYRLECMLLGGLSLNRTRNMSPQLWPRFQWWNGTNITQALVNQQTWQLSPYSRTLSLSLIPLEGAQTNNLLQCHFANLTIQARIQSTKPTEPVIMDVGAIDAHRKTKNEQSGSLFHLYCQVVGFPLPDIYWELGFLDSAQKISLEWIKFHTCNAPHELNSSFTSHACNITVRSSELLRAEQIRLVVAS